MVGIAQKDFKPGDDCLIIFKGDSEDPSRYFAGKFIGYMDKNHPASVELRRKSPYDVKAVRARLTDPRINDDKDASNHWIYQGQEPVCNYTVVSYGFGFEKSREHFEGLKDVIVQKESELSAGAIELEESRAEVNSLKGLLNETNLAYLKSQKRKPLAYIAIAALTVVATLTTLTAVNYYGQNFSTGSVEHEPTRLELACESMDVCR